MTIGKGTTWGTAGPLEDGAPVVNSDAALRAIAVECLGAGVSPPTAGLTATGRSVPTGKSESPLGTFTTDAPGRARIIVVDPPPSSVTASTAR